MKERERERGRKDLSNQPVNGEEDSPQSLFPLYGAFPQGAACGLPSVTRVSSRCGTKRGSHHPELHQGQRHALPQWSLLRVAGGVQSIWVGLMAMPGQWNHRTYISSLKSITEAWCSALPCSGNLCLGLSQPVRSSSPPNEHL